MSGRPALSGPPCPARQRRVACQSPRKGGVVLMLGSMLISLPADYAAAQQWQIRPNAGIGLKYDDNVRSTAENAEGSFVTNLGAAVRAVRSTENTNLDLAAGLRLNGFSDVSDLDNTSGFLGLDTAYRGERNQFALNTSLDTQSTLTSEASTSGLTQINKQRYQVVVGPSWMYLVSERSSLSLGLSYTGVFYEDMDTDLAPLFDYRQGTATLGGTYRLTERAGVNGELTYGRYEAQGIRNEYDNFGAQVGIDYLITETLSLDFLVGLRRTEATFSGADGAIVSEESTGPSYRVNLVKRSERGGGFSLQAFRNLVPSGTAELLDTSGLRLGFNYPFSERWRFGLNASGLRNRQPGGESSLSDRNSAVINVTVGYSLSESVNLSAGYSARWQNRDESSGNAVSNSIFLNLAWSRPWDL